MSTLETQYKNYLKQNPDSKLSFEEWGSQILVKPINEFLNSITPKPPEPPKDRRLREDGKDLIPPKTYQ
jgi:hypothetical protein